MKRLKHIINWTIWSIIGLYVLLLVLIHVPAVQQYLGQKVANAIGNKLNTEVKIGRVDLGFFNRLIIDDVVIKDQKHSEMLKANRLTMKIELLPLLDGSIRISSAQLFGLHAKLYKETAQSTPNYQFVFDALKSKKKEEPSRLDVHINSIIIRHSSVEYDDWDAKETPDTFNVKHLNFSDISAYIQLKTLTNDSLHVNVKRLAFHEHSGLQVNRFNFRLQAGQHIATISDLCLQMPHSQIKANLLQGNYDKARLDETLAFKGSIDDTQIDLNDLVPLLPVLKSFKNSLSITSTFEGTAKSLNVNQLSIRSDDSDFSLLASGFINDGIWHAQIAHLAIANKLFANIKQVIPNLPEFVTRMGDITLSGVASRLTDGNITTQADLQTSIGQMGLRFAMDDHQHFDGHIDTDGFNLCQFLERDDFGLLATQIDFSGSPDSLRAEGTVSRIDYRDYSYQNIELKTSLTNSLLAGRMRINDPHVQTDIEGEIRRTERMTVSLTGNIQNLSPGKLNLTDKWGDASFSAVFDANFTASSLNDAEGNIDLGNFVMTSGDSLRHTFHLDNIHVRSGFDDHIHYVKFNGDFGVAQLTGQFDWATLPQSFINYISSKLPTLPNLPHQEVATNNNFELNLQLSDSRWLKELFGLPLDFDNSLMLDAIVNDQQNTVDVSCTIPPFSYGSDRYLGGKVLLTTDEDTTRCIVNVTKVLDKGRQLELHLNALAADNTIRSAVNFHNHDGSGDPAKSIYGIINAIAQLYTNEQQNPEMQVRIMPSHLMIQGTQWNLEPCVVLYSDKRLTLDHFNLHNRDQHLIVDGVASANSNDSLTVDLQDIDIASILELVNFRSVRFGGLASGQAYLTEVFDDFNAWAELTVDDFTFLDGPMGTLTANAYWNPDVKRLDLHAKADAGNGAETYISGFVSPTDKEVDINIIAQGSPISFCHFFTKSFLRDIHGKAYGELRVAGPMKEIDLTGDMAVFGQATVGALNTTYDLRGDTIHFAPGDIGFSNFRLYDKNDHMAQIAGDVRHRYLKQFTFDLSITTDNVLVYDFPDFGQSTICGTVFATGKAGIQGQPGEVIINVDVTPNRNSTFAYNAANPDAISQQQFITWSDRDNREVDLLSPIATKIPSDLRINFRINATPDATLRVLMDASSGDAITLQGNGVINASFYNKGPFQMFGTYSVERGTYSMTIQNIIKKNFNFQEGGSIIFGGNPFDAALNLNAVYTVNGVSLSDLQLGNSFTNNTVRVNCLMNILGTAGAPRVEFDLEMPNVNAEEQQMIRSIIASEQELNQQVVYLLGIGRFYTQGANNAGSQEYGQTELAMQSFLSGTVSTQINEVLSQVIKNDDWNFGANISTGNEGWHNAEYEGLISGRMLNNRLLVNGQFGYRDNATQATPSFIGDFDIRYLLYPNGNLALKVYNQTNDRYFTRSSLNTQGIGLIMKKDFNGLGELFKRNKKRKTKN